VLKLTKKDKRTEIEKELDDLVLGLRGMDIGSGDYQRQLVLIERLHKLKGEKPPKWDWHSLIQPAMVIGGNFALAVLVLKHEELNIIATKAFGFIVRGRV